MELKKNRRWYLAATHRLAYHIPNISWGNNHMDRDIFKGTLFVGRKSPYFKFKVYET